MLVLSVHAARQASRRGIALAEITEAWVQRTTSYPSQQGPDKLVILGVTNAGRRLKVVVLAAAPDYVVTVADRDQEG